MRNRKKRPFWLLTISFLSLAGLFYLAFSLSPSSQLSIFNFQFSIIILFFLLIFVFIFSLFSFLFKNTRRGLFLGLLAGSFLLLRLFSLTQIIFPLLLVFLYITLEFFFSKQK
ncbi:hypothetical protein C4559_06080 [Candidatus Microgenomates bacterium]|nr:MAG: hypothetical protein C4559_06080 [Candidatus Microgenomates bacterium]